nr:K Homology domain containing protein [Haemonchus contortus]
MIPDDVVLLQDGRYEMKIQVDRRRLEAMITGAPTNQTDFIVMNAEEFFNKVKSYSGAEVCWPSQLKIGAKTKKDPFVKVIGTLNEIEQAKKYISSALQVKKERVTLKMDIHHSIHSHIIGKAGRGIQQIMRSTGCHIHFPDSNKYTDSTNKSDQVSISGLPLNVEKARKVLRAVSPLVLTFDLPWIHRKEPEIRQFPPNVVVTLSAIAPTLYSCVMKSNAGDEDNILRAISLIMTQFDIPEEFPVIVRTTFNVKEDLVQVLRNGKESQRLQQLAQRYGVQLQISETPQPVLVYGPASGVLLIRKFIMGLSQVILSFDVPASEFSLDFERLQREYDLLIHSKKKNNTQDILAISIRSTEENMLNILRARESILGIAVNTYFDNEYTALKMQQESFFSDPSSESNVDAPLCSLFDPLPEVPKSPDPIDSPIASSILKGAKEYNKKGDLWNKAVALRADRDRMLLKATQAIFDDSALSKAPRYPTDLWAGYGFSYSLPAELLKGIMDISEEEPVPEGRPILGKDAKTTVPRGLCAVREEDELSEFSGSFSSNSMNSANRIFPTKNGSG